MFSLEPLLFFLAVTLTNAVKLALFHHIYFSYLFDKTSLSLTLQEIT